MEGVGPYLFFTKWGRGGGDDNKWKSLGKNPSDDSKACHDFRDSKIGKNWLETHVYIPKYCLQIAKCNKKHETQKISGFYQSLALQHLRPKSYEKCMKLPYDLHCPSRKRIMPITYVYIYSARKYVQRKNCCYITLKQHNTMHTKILTWSLLRMICMRMKKRL